MAGWSYMTLSHDHNISAHVHNCLVCELPSDEWLGFFFVVTSCSLCVGNYTCTTGTKSNPYWSGPVTHR